MNKRINIIEVFSIILLLTSTNILNLSLQGGPKWLRHTRNDNITMHFKEEGREGVDWNNLDQIRVQ
jgi:hypothetical protein